MTSNLLPTLVIIALAFLLFFSNLKKNKNNNAHEMTEADWKSITDVGLETVNWSSKSLNSITCSFKGGERVRRLWLNENELTNIPESLFNLVLLTELWLQQNELKTIKHDHWSKLKQLEHLWLNDNVLDDASMPDNFPLSLRELQLGTNMLQTLPTALFQLTNLQTLCVSENQLTQLDFRICELTALVSLDLSDNAIPSIPSSVAQLLHLKTLDMSRNKLSSIPDALGDLASLEALNLGTNRLSELDIDLSLFKHMTALDVSFNQLNLLPDSLFQLGATLKSLDISNNFLFAMQPAIVRLTSLTRLNCVNNKFSNVSETMLMKRGPKLLKHFETKKHAAKRVKVLVLGELGSGRTSVVKSILASDKKSRSTVNYESTSLTIHDWHCRAPLASSSSSSRKVSVSLWDFHRDSGYETSHQFFVTDNTIVVIVFDMSLPIAAARLHFWLTSVRARAPMAPVLLFGTHADMMSAQEAAAVCAKVSADVGVLFKLVTHIADVDARSAASAVALREALQSVISKCPAVTRQISTRYSQIEQAMVEERNHRKLMFYNDFRSICGRHSVVTEAELSNAAAYLHDVGVLLHYDVPRGALDQMYILAPSYLIDVCHSLLNNSFDWLIKDGVLKHFDLFMVWAEYAADTYEPVLALLEHYELCFQLSGPVTNEICFADGSSLFPSLLDDLPLETPPPIVELGTAYFRIYQFRQVYPRSLFGHVLVRTMHCTNPDQGWTVIRRRRALYVARRDVEAVITEDHVQRRLIIETRGHSPARMLALLLDIVEMSLADWYPRTPVDVYVPCSHCRAKKLWPPYLFDVVDAESTLRDGMRVMTCQRDAALDQGVKFYDQSFSQSANLELRFFNDPVRPHAKVRRHTLNSAFVGARRSSRDQFGEVRRGSTRASDDVLNMPRSPLTVDLTDLVPDICLVGLLTVEYDQLKLKEVLGGGLGTRVYSALLYDQPVAVKTLQITDSLPDHPQEQSAAFRRECTLLGGLSHPNIISLIGICLSPLSMITQLATGGDLTHFLADRSNKLTHKLTLDLAMDVLRGLVYLQSLTPPIVHRDLKSPNVLLNRPDAVSFGLQNRRRNSYVPESRRDEQMQAPQTRNFRSVSVSDQLSASFVSADSSATSAHRSSTTGTTESSSAMLSAVEAATSQSRAGLSNSPLPLCSSVNGEQSSATSSTLLSDSSTSDDDTNDDDTRPRYRAMLGDLGLSRALTSGVVERTVDNPRWLPPEVLEASAPYSLASDMYSFGLVLWELYARELPFEEFSYRFDARLEEAIMGGLRPSMPLHAPEPVCSLIKALLHTDPAKRPKAHETLEKLSEARSLAPPGTIGSHIEKPKPKPLYMAIEVPPIQLSNVRARRMRRQRQARRAQSSSSSTMELGAAAHDSATASSSSPRHTPPSAHGLSSSSHGLSSSSRHTRRAVSPRTRRHNNPHRTDSTSPRQERGSRLADVLSRSDAGLRTLSGSGGLRTLSGSGSDIVGIDSTAARRRRHAPLHASAASLGLINTLDADRSPMLTRSATIETTRVQSVASMSRGQSSPGSRKQRTTHSMTRSHGANRSGRHTRNKNANKGRESDPSSLAWSLASSSSRSVKKRHTSRGTDSPKELRSTSQESDPRRASSDADSAHSPPILSRSDNVGLSASGKTNKHRRKSRS